MRSCLNRRFIRIQLIIIIITAARLLDAGLHKALSG